MGVCFEKSREYGVRKGEFACTYGFGYFDVHSIQGYERARYDANDMEGNFLFAICYYDCKISTNI